MYEPFTGLHPEMVYLDGVFAILADPTVSTDPIWNDRTSPDYLVIARNATNKMCLQDTFLSTARKTHTQSR